MPESAPAKAQAKVDRLETKEKGKGHTECHMDLVDSVGNQVEAKTVGKVEKVRKEVVGRAAGHISPEIAPERAWAKVEEKLDLSTLWEDQQLGKDGSQNKKSGA